MRKRRVRVIYLCCGKEKKELYKKKIKSYYRDAVFFSDMMCECDAMFVIGNPDKTMENEIVQAKERKIKIETLDVNKIDRSMDLIDAKEWESAFSARNRSREYEL